YDILPERSQVETELRPAYSLKFSSLIDVSFFCTLKHCDVKCLALVIFKSKRVWLMLLSDKTIIIFHKTQGTCLNPTSRSWAGAGFKTNTHHSKITNTIH